MLQETRYFRNISLPRYANWKPWNRKDNIKQAYNIIYIKKDGTEGSL